MQNEVWKWVPNAPGYRVSNYGRIASHWVQGCGSAVRWRIRPKVLRCHLSSGYVVASLKIDGRQVLRKVHQLVLEAFVGPRPNGMVTCHNDGDSSNNRLENLRYGTPADNGADTARHGILKGERSPLAKLTDEDVRAIRLDPRPQVRIAADYGVCQQIISQVKRGAIWSHVV